MTAKEFREIALSMPETEERAHMDHTDFRVARKIFATLGYPDKTHAMIKLSVEDQHYFCKDHPDAFAPVKGAWGRRWGHLRAPQNRGEDVLRKAIQGAWRNIAPTRLTEK